MRTCRERPTHGRVSLADPNADPKALRFQTLVSLMLSSQTKDAVTAAAVRRLQEAFPPYGFDIPSIANIENEKLKTLIHGVGFQNKKVIYLKKTAQILHEQYDNDIPQTIKELCKLPGVGPKMSHLTMQHAWGTMSGIGVDVHVHRITNRLGWVKTNTPEQTRKSLEEWLPREHWNTINVLLVGLGQQICKAKPLCSQCKARPYCKLGRSLQTSKGQTKKKKIIKSKRQNGKEEHKEETNKGKKIKKQKQKEEHELSMEDDESIKISKKKASRKRNSKVVSTEVTTSPYFK